MADSFDYQIVGLNSIITALNELPGKTTNRIKMKLQASADNVYTVSQQLVPVDTGDLKASGHVEVEPASEAYIGFAVVYGDGNGTATLYVYSEGDADGYAWFTELGTVNMAAQPYLGNAFEEESQKLLTTIGDILEG